VLAAATSAQATTYVFSTISAPTAPAGDVNQALSISDSGQILVSALNPIGPYPDNVDVNDVYNLHTGVYTPLASFPGAVANSSLANGINASGVTVGQYDPGGGTPFAPALLGYENKGGVFTTVDPFGDPFTFAIGISNNGQITGGAVDFSSPNPQVGFLGSGDHFTAISVPGAPTAGQGVNNAGTVVGDYFDFANGVSKAFIDVGGVVSPFTAPGWAATFASGINNQGDIVGQVSNDGFATSEGFIDDNGAFTFLSFPGGATGGLIGAINDAGDLVGEYTDSNGNVQAFLATPHHGKADALLSLAADPTDPAPVPEPATWLMLLLGAGAIGASMRTKRKPKMAAGLALRAC
jgi:hypothetical protein